VTRNTTDGKVQLKQVWNKPDAAEKDVTLTMTLTNRSSATLSAVVLTRTGDFDVGTAATGQGATTGDSTWQWDDQSATDDPPVGLMITALNFGIPHSPTIERVYFWDSLTEPTRDNCFGAPQNTPTPVDDFAMRMNYHLGILSAGQSKTVKLLYGRM
jgi:hypothetical protein